MIIHLLPSLLRVHINLFSSDWVRTLWVPKRISYVSVCSFGLFVPFIRSPLRFFDKNFPILFLFVCYLLISLSINQNLKRRNQYNSPYQSIGCWNVSQFRLCGFLSHSPPLQTSACLTQFYHVIEEVFAISCECVSRHRNLKRIVSLGNVSPN